MPRREERDFIPEPLPCGKLAPRDFEAWIGSTRALDKTRLGERKLGSTADNDVVQNTNVQ